MASRGESTYAGQRERGLPHGQGRMDFYNGGNYDGSWKHGFRDGFGIMEWDDGSTYKGEWRDGFPHGQGELLEAPPSGEESLDEDPYSISYEGEWHLGESHGKGIERYSDGAIYEGKFRYSRPHGKGVLEFGSKPRIFPKGRPPAVAGERYEGVWFDGFLHGKGRYIFSEELSYECEYEFSRLVRLTVTSEDNDPPVVLEDIDAMIDAIDRARSELSKTDEG